MRCPNCSFEMPFLRSQLLLSFKCYSCPGCARLVRLRPRDSGIEYLINAVGSLLLVISLLGGLQRSIGVSAFFVGWIASILYRAFVARLEFCSPRSKIQ